MTTDYSAPPVYVAIKDHEIRCRGTYPDCQAHVVQHSDGGGYTLPDHRARWALEHEGWSITFEVLADRSST